MTNLMAQITSDFARVSQQVSLSVGQGPSFTLYHQLHTQDTFLTLPLGILGSPGTCTLVYDLSADLWD
jgi:hypothetical protein